MSKGFFTELDERALVRVKGDDAAGFLHGLFTCDVENLAEGESHFGALLSPQGKILFDFFIIRDSAGFLIDVDKQQADELTKRLTFYKLRAKVEIERANPAIKIFAYWNDRATRIEKANDAIIYKDPRLASLGHRMYAMTSPEYANLARVEDYHKHRIQLGMPQGGIDFEYGDAFPHEALMDQFKGVDFAKGCYVGQEVVSRMQHRGTARKRFVKVRADEELPVPGNSIIADGKTVGTLTSKAGQNGIALIRLDNAAEAVASSRIVKADDIPVQLSIQDWANFDWPATT